MWESFSLTMLSKCALPHVDNSLSLPFPHFTFNTTTLAGFIKGMQPSSIWCVCAYSLRCSKTQSSSFSVSRKKVREYNREKCVTAALCTLISRIDILRLAIFTLLSINKCNWNHIRVITWASTSLWALFEHSQQNCRSCVVNVANCMHNSTLKTFQAKY